MFAALLVFAQVALFLVLRLRKEDSGRNISPDPRTIATSSLPTAPSVVPLADPPRPETQPGPENGPTSTTAAPAGGQEPAGSQTGDRDGALATGRDKDRRERAEQDLARSRLETERDRMRLQAEKERLRVEAERVEKARLEAERARVQLEAERAALAAERSRLASLSAPPPIPPSGNPKTLPAGVPKGPQAARPAGVLVVLISAAGGAGSLSREDVRNIYFGKTTAWPDSTPVRAFTRPAGSPAGSVFFRSVLGMSSSAYGQHWTELEQGGQPAPGIVWSAEAMVTRVAATPGAIGYLLESELPADVSGVRLIRF